MNLASVVSDQLRKIDVVLIRVTILMFGVRPAGNTTKGSAIQFKFHHFYKMLPVLRPFFGKVTHLELFHSSCQNVHKFACTTPSCTPHSCVTKDTINKKGKSTVVRCEQHQL